MKRIGMWLMVVVGLGLTAGCFNTAGLNTENGVAGVAATAMPQYASAIEQIKSILVGKSINPIEGFDQVIIYKYKGEEIDPADLAREIIYKKREAIRDSQFVRATEKGEPIPIAESEDAVLRSEIEAILNAAGVLE